MTDPSTPAKRYRHVQFGSMKTGFLELKRDGRLLLNTGESFKATKFHASDVTSVAIEDASELQRRPTVMRAGGGAVAGGILLGPVGLLAGLGLGAIAQKKTGGEKYLVLELADDRTIVVTVPRNRIVVAEKMRDQLTSD